MKSSITICLICLFLCLCSSGSWATQYTMHFADKLIEGDVNQDCRVNLNDLALMAANWLRCTRIPAMACNN
jgi:hypothetical protein